MRSKAPLHFEERKKGTALEYGAAQHLHLATTAIVVSSCHRHFRSCGSCPLALCTFLRFITQLTFGRCEVPVISHPSVVIVFVTQLIKNRQW